MNTERDLNVINRILNRGLTVGQLREQLEGMDDDTAVVFVCDYGDYTHTQQALTVEEVMEVEAKDLYTSAYSQSGLALHEDDRDGDEDDEEELDEEEKAEKAKYEAMLEDMPKVVVLR